MEPPVLWEETQGGQVEQTLKNILGRNLKYVFWSKNNKTYGLFKYKIYLRLD